MSTGNKYVCPECGGQVGLSESVCRHCGMVMSPLPDEPARPHRFRVEPETGRKRNKPRRGKKGQ